MKRILILIGLILLSNALATAQQDIKIMQYNLLNYGNDFNDCTQTSNNIDHKNEQLEIIIDYVKPDIFCVNEMDASLTDVNYLMTNVLNINGVDYWAHASKSSSSYTMNMLYYNSDIFTLNSQENIYGNPRQLDVYNLTHNASSVQFKVIVGHLKASEGSDNEVKRADATQNLMNYLNNKGPGNYLFMGDFNIYTSSEQAFQNLINYNNSSVNFYDPVNRIGAWHNSYSFSDVHTQSTHSSSNGCASTGGMDDRFDFILISEDIKDGNNDVTYIANSYETIGQDGNHYNDAINDGTNNSAPTNVIDALYEMSDHVPVSLELRIGAPSEPETVFNKDFEDQSISSGGWTEYSVVDENRKWHVPSTTYGHNNSYCAKMSGYYSSSSTLANEDWLISPTFNANVLQDESLSFWLANNYAGSDLELFYSTNYSGTGDPNLSNWTEITNFNIQNVSSGNFDWVSSGEIDLSNISGTDVHIAFKFSCNDGESKLWEVDDIILKAVNPNSISELENNNLVALNIYPNPSHNQINISYKLNKKTNVIVEIFDITGTNLYTKTEKEQNLGSYSLKLNVKELGLKEGLYLVKINNSLKKLIIK